MANKIEKPPTETAMEKKAKIIGHKLEEMKRKCATEAEKKTISIDEMVFIIEFMADQLTTGHRHLFEDHFVSHFRILSKRLQINDNQTDELASTLKSITEILCRVAAIKELPTSMLSSLLTKWLQCLERIPRGSKYRIYQEINCGLRRNCARFLTEAPRYSLRMQMLDIVCSYLHGADDSTKKLSTFLEDFEGVVDAHENGDFVGAASKMIDAETAFLAVKEKHRVLNALNGFAADRSIHAVPITTLKFKNLGETEQEFDAEWMHVNTVTGTIEFSGTDKIRSKTMCIEARKVHNIELIESADDQSLEVKFVFISKSQQQAEQDESTETGKWIKITMAADCVKCELTALLAQVFPAIDLGCDGNTKESKPEELMNGQNLTTVEVNLSRSSTNDDDSSFYDGGGDNNGAVVQVTASQGVELQLEISNGSSYKNIFVSTPRKRPATMTMCEKDDEPCEKKPCGPAKTSVAPSSAAANLSNAKSNPMLSVKIAIRDWTRSRATDETVNDGVSTQTQSLANQQPKRRNGRH